VTLASVPFLVAQKEQVKKIKTLNDGSPISIEQVTITADGAFSKDLDIRENDVFLFHLKKQDISDVAPQK
jgi:hypothetical protein